MSEPDLRDPRLDRVYRELPGEEPPPEVDERIRAAARRAVGAGPQSLAARERSWTSRWRVPLSLAASVVVVVTLTLMVQEEEQQRALDVAPALAPAPAAPATLEDRAAPSRAPEEAKRADTEPARRAPASAPPQRAPAADAAAPPPAPQVARSAEEWIEEIRRLKAQGRDADAAAELAEFRRRHPEYPLPVDLAR